FVCYRIVPKDLSKMASLEIIIFLCSMISFMPSYCKAESENSNKRTNLPKFLSELDLSSVEGSSAENTESLKTIVKRLAPEKNGEYQIYQVFFGNADLLKEWLKGAGVTGQPGVDFPALTTIPATSFSCRGLKGGYYADLETNCQVFHICDNGRKISFLCPNGTIFQQSQLICDWWFKVDCSKSTELYEQSSEQLIEEERRRAESRKSKLDYQQSIESGGQQDYYDVQNLSYDGKQNGRIKTYEEPPLENQVQDRVKTSRYFDAGNNFSQESSSQRDGGQLFGSNGFQTGQTSSVKPQFNQFTRNTDEGTMNRYPTTSQDYYSTPKKAQNYHVAGRNTNGQRDEKGALKRLKFKSFSRNNTTSTVAQRVTPSYTESTTFRASNTSPAKESQQFAESAAFVGNRGNWLNENSGNSHQYYYQLYVNRDSTTRSPDYEQTTATIDRGDVDVSTQRNDYSLFTDPVTSTTYETTTQYPTTTVTPPCNDDVTESLVTNPSTNPDLPPTTESLLFANSNYEYRGNFNYNVNRNKDRITGTSNSGTDVPVTTRFYPTTENYRYNSVTPSSVQQKYTTNQFAPLPTSSVRSNSFGRSTESTVTRSAFDGQYSRPPGGKNPTTISPVYRQNYVTTTTEKPFKTTLAYQQNTATEKDLSPYDRSFTYKQGKVMSTLGPYVPFTRNYQAYSTTGTPARSTPYTPTVPTYTSAKTLIPKLKHSTSSTPGKSKSNAARFSEREHALSMLHSLKNLENHVPSLSDNLKVNEKTPNLSGPPAPATLHSLALYFSTATENFDSNEATDSSISPESEEDAEKSNISKKSNGTVTVPSGLLTQHTIDSYTELFKLNDAFENNNVTTEDRLDNTSVYGEDYNEDLELQQSGGSLDDLRKTNSTRLRELAQVFTHALSAYLLDPDTFKKVLTEIRPTEPSSTTLDSEQWRTTTEYPDEDYTVSVREKDEVLDFSDDGNDLRQKLTTVYPTTYEPPTTVQESVYDSPGTLPSTYYTTPKTSSQESYEPSTNLVSTNSVTNTYIETSMPPTETMFSAEPSSTPYSSDSSMFYEKNNEIDKGPQVTDNYIPVEETGNRVGGFQNNSATTVTEPYVDGRSFVTTPISDNYVVSPTPVPESLFAHMATYNWNKKATSKKPEQQLTPPFYESYAETVRRENERAALNLETYPSTPMSAQAVRVTTSNPKIYETPIDQPRKLQHHKSVIVESRPGGISHSSSRSSYTKFRNVYNRVDEHNLGSTERATTTVRSTEPTTSTTTDVDTTPCAHTDPNNSFETVSQKEEPKLLSNNHWTSSPAVTHLWETSVFVDPQRINHGLESDVSTTVSSGTDSFTGSNESLEYGNTPSLDDASSSTEDSNNESNLPHRLSREKDSPTTFSLLPTSFATDNTATPKPLITTRSSITTTITSSITSTNSLPQEALVSSLLPYTVSSNENLNGTEKEVAEKLFGKLNASSTSTLMRVMKQADNNETVRQLVLLLVRHCNDPVNKTMQREKEELLNALLRLPVNEFASEESRNVVAGINRLTVSSVDQTTRARSPSSAATFTEPPVTTFRSKKSRRFRTTTESSAGIVRRSEKTTDSVNSLQEDETSASDGRALELLRSLYTIATKWG
ncbi:chitin-binding domain protein thawb, partial [Ptiloglossa arizonensis]|uniref:chitin-binding domain protein thawb n=1 Tax=Ptiloglossa arizonensis TaxID=3350558 RepID=UPI003F9EE663